MKRFLAAMVMTLALAVSAIAGPQIDINTATQAQLRAVPGIGAGYSARIIAGRPYKGRDELLKKNVLPPDVYAKTMANFVAKQPKK